MDRAGGHPVRATGWPGRSIPLPGSGFNWQSVGVPADWPHFFSGFAAHWNKNANLGKAFDVWFLNLFPRAQPFVFNDGGYLTLSFIPTLGTMILGLIAGQLAARQPRQRIPMRRLADRRRDRASPPACCCISPASAPS